MRVLDKRSRDRLALFYAILAFGSLLLGVIAGALSPRDALPWIYPIAGLVGYVIFAQRAMRLWRRGSTPPARSRTYRWSLTSSALMLAAPGASAQQTIFKNGDPKGNATLLEPGSRSETPAREEA
jgi:hypothetical protein